MDDSKFFGGSSQSELMISFLKEKSTNGLINTISKISDLDEDRKKIINKIVDGNIKATLKEMDNNFLLEMKREERLNIKETQKLVDKNIELEEKSRLKIEAELKLLKLKKDMNK